MLKRLKLPGGVMVVALVAGLAGCDSGGSTGPGPASLEALGVTGSAGNGLTATVALRLNGVDSLRVRYSAAGEGVGQTPVRPATGDSLAIRVAGLRAATEYKVWAEGWHGSSLISSDTVSFASGALPAALASFTLSFSTGNSTTGGYTLLPALIGTAGYLVIFDSTGTIRWYRETTPLYPGAAPADLKQLPNGNILAYVGGTRGWDPVDGRYYEFNLDGDIVRTYGAPPPLYTDNHDVVLQFSDTTLVSSTFFSYDIRVLDLTPYGGAPGVAVGGHQIIRQRADGAAAFFWNAWDHFSLLDWIEEPQTLKQGPSADFDHPNSLVLDLDGNYIVSWRSMGEISKIDARTGAIIWRWGGRNNQFSFVNDPLGLFSGQHSVKVLPNGHFLLYDNGLRHVPPETRVAEYQLDPVAHTATLVWEYRHAPAIFTPVVGWVERLASGNTFIGWGAAGVLQEITPDKSTVWEARVLSNGAASAFYRAQLMADLYGRRLP